MAGRPITVLYLKKKLFRLNLFFVKFGTVDYIILIVISVFSKGKQSLAGGQLLYLSMANHYRTAFFSVAIMPKVSEGASYRKEYTEEDIVKALEAIENGMAQREASKLYRIPRATLQFRSSNKFNNKVSFGPNPILTSEEEAVLERWILTSHKKGFPRRMEDIQASVKYFLDATPRENPFQDNLPGRGWYQAFLKRHPNITLRTSEGITAASSVVAEADIRNWFSNVEDYLKEKQLFDVLEDPSRIYNGDETCFWLCPKNKKVLAPRGAKNVYEIQHHPKNNITVMFTFSACGDVTPPMIIYAYKRLPTEIVKSVPETWGIGCSDNGWMKNHLFYEYIGNVFYPYLKQNNIKFPIALFVDGHSTHLTYEISELCTKLEIILIALYPNSTRIMQPADVAVFKPLKEGWKKAVLKFRREYPTEVVTKENFAGVLNTVVNNVKPEGIRNGFRACGLFPWNSSAIDYSKCTAKKKEDPDKEIKEITFETFKKVVGEEKMERLKNFDVNEAHNSDFSTLFYLYKEFLKANSSVDMDQVDDMNQFEDTDKPEETDHLESKVLYKISESESYLKNNNLIDQNNESFTKHTFEIAVNEQVGFDIDNIPIVIEGNTDFDGQKPSTFKLGHEQSELNKSSSSISDFVVWPKTPERKGKRETEKLPFVLTSSVRKKAIKEKIDKKKEMEVEKEKRKTERLNKKELKEKQIKEKQTYKKKLIIKRKSKTQNNAKEPPNNNNDKFVFKNNIDSEGVTSRAVDTGRTFYLTGNGCASKKDSTIISVNDNDAFPNIPESSPETFRHQPEIVTSIIEVPERTKRKLFSENNEDEEGSVKKVINITNMVIIKPSAPNPFTNQTIYSGLCFACVNNIARSQYGVKCVNCTRTYHIKCIAKNRMKSSEMKQFMCNVCFDKMKL